MKRIFALFVAVALIVGVAGYADAAGTPAKKAAASKPIPKDPCAAQKSKYLRQHCHDFNNSAAADEYFGRMKMSYLGIENMFHDESIRSGPFTVSPNVITSLNFADNAMRAWSDKYPNDPELARGYFLAIRAYSKVYTQPMQDRAWQYMHILMERFPQTFFGKQVKKNLQVGFTERYFTDPVPCVVATPAPALQYLPNGRPAPTPSPTDTPSPTPEPTLAPTPQPGQPKIEILTPPCVAATPQPTPEPATPTPAATPIGAPILPAPTPSAGPMPTPTPVPTPTPTSTP